MADRSTYANSFGEKALTTEPQSSSDRNSTSYVVLSTKVKSDTSATDQTMLLTATPFRYQRNARLLEVTVPGGMVNTDIHQGGISQREG